MISQATIQAIRERTDIVALIGENVRLKKQGRRWVGLCPFHKEKTPSFSVNQERGLYHCFGCKASGSAVDYVMQLEGMSFPEAIRALGERLNIEVEETRDEGDRARAQQRRREREELFQLNALCADFFAAQLREHPLAALAREEIARRGLDPDHDPVVARALEAFRIGYAPYGWNALGHYLERQGIDLGRAADVGVVTPRRGGGGGTFDAFRHRLMFAVIDKSGRVVAFSGRALPEPEPERLAAAGLEPMYRRPDPERRDPPKYINSPESPIYVKGDNVFGLYQARRDIRERGYAVLVEGNFDVLSLHARGFGLAVAPLGTAFTPGQARLVKRYAPTVVVMFDADRAGTKATAALRIPAREGGLSARVAQLPDGMDPDDVARTHGVEAVEAAARGAKGMLEFMVDELIGDQAIFDDHSRRGILKRIRRVAELIAEETDGDMRLMAKAYADEVASRVSVAGTSPGGLQALERMMRQAMRAQEQRRRRPPGPSSSSSASSPDGRYATLGGAEDGGGGSDAREVHYAADKKLAGASGRSRSRVAHIALEAFGAILDFPELLEESEVERYLAELEGAVALGVAAVRQVWDAKKALDGPEILDLLPPAIHSFAVGRLASPRFSDRDEARVELVDNAKKLRRRSLAGDNAAKVQELNRADALGDTDAADELLREMSRKAKEKVHL
ncbi:MAG: CHC2 zinc finger domain-containing protein [Myxococcota bacterium]